MLVEEGEAWGAQVTVDVTLANDLKSISIVSMLIHALFP